MQNLLRARLRENSTFEHRYFQGGLPLQARRIIDDNNGIGVYRNGFRIRPLGNSDFDWLRLNQKRVQNPSMRIGSQQAIGFVLIEQEELSNLIEKSARDGLRDNKSYESLKDITGIVINKLEERRFKFKRSTSKKNTKSDETIDSIFSSEKLKQDIKDKLIKNDIDEKKVLEILEIVEKDEKSRSKKANNLKEVIAIYQGQATLGKIINIVIHEGRRPLNVFRNELPRIQRYIEKYKETNDSTYLDDSSNISEELIQSSKEISELFKKIDPLATGKRGKRKDFELSKMIKSSLAVYESTMRENSIDYSIDGDLSIVFLGWPQDIRTIFLNLLDNSIFWLNENKILNKKITIFISLEDSNSFYIDFKDSGLGIEDSLIEDNTIFEPEFSTKSDGMGLGLAIAGEAAHRNGLALKAISSESGAYFRLQTKDFDGE